jgi:hypothetical protein
MVAAAWSPLQPFIEQPTHKRDMEPFAGFGMNRETSGNGQRHRAMVGGAQSPFRRNFAHR